MDCLRNPYDNGAVHTNQKAAFPFATSSDQDGWKTGRRKGGTRGPRTRRRRVQLGQEERIGTITRPLQKIVRTWTQGFDKIFFGTSRRRSSPVQCSMTSFWSSPSVLMRERTSRTRTWRQGLLCDIRLGKTYGVLYTPAKGETVLNGGKTVLHVVTHEGLTRAKNMQITDNRRPSFQWPKSVRGTQSCSWRMAVCHREKQLLRRNRV